MSGGGAPALEPVPARGLRVGVVAGCWHADVADALLAGALRGLADCGIDTPSVVRVPGAFELPVAAAALARGHDAVVCLGVVIRGGTPHFDYVCRAATDGCTRVALDSGVPVGFGVLTCDSVAQAAERVDKGRAAALAAVRTALVLRELPGAGSAAGQVVPV